MEDGCRVLGLGIEESSEFLPAKAMQNIFAPEIEKNCKMGAKNFLLLYHVSFSYNF